MSGMQPIPMLADYGTDGCPVIAQEFTDRWRRTGLRKRASASWLRKLRHRGVTHVAVEVAPDRVADFTVDELLGSVR